MSDEESTLEVNGTVTNVTSPSSVTPENIPEILSELKKGPPVAPKPAWFRQSLRKIRDEQDQKKQAKQSEQRPDTGFGRSFNIRSASSEAKPSFKQKIHSFETFSSPESPEKGSNRRPVASSASLSPVQKGSRGPWSSYSASHEDNVKNKPEFPREIQSKESAPVREEDNIPVSAAPSAITSTPNEACSQTTAKSSEDEPPFSQSPTDPLCPETISTDLDSGINDNHSTPVHDNSKVLPPKLNSEQERVDLSDPSVHCPETSMESNQNEDQNTSDRTEGEGKLLKTTPSAASATESNSLSSPDSENLGKIITFSNQVSQALMRSLPISSHVKPCSTNLQDTSELDDNNQQESESGLDTSDRAFSVSLATLRECTIEQGESGFHNETASASAHSVISAIPSQEILGMIEEVKALDEATLKQLVNIHVVILHKEEGAGMGFSIAGGCDLESKAITVHRVFPSGLAAQEGTIQKGDEVLSINGQTLRGVTHSDATTALRQARSLKLAVVVVYKRAEEEGRDEGSCRSEEPNPAEEEWGAPVSVVLEKGVGGVGFTLEGGKGSIHGDRPLVIKKIFQGGAAEQSGLESGNEVLEVQGVSLQDMTRFEAWNMIKALPEGPITVVLRRRLGGVE
uniref:PDZ domain-containing protein n=1 Tax=Amphilophus citrinellus TaxID=61819 RepID=A0A3Q0R2D4_AMPCI